MKRILLLLLMATIVRATQVAAFTTGGPTQALPASGAPGFSATNPVRAALVWCGPSTTAGTALDHARFSIGFTDGTRTRCISLRSRDNQAITSTVRNGFNNQLLSIFSASLTSAAGEASLSSLGNDRVTVSWGTLPPSAWLVNALLFGGADALAYVGEFQSSATDNDTTVVDSTSHSGFNFGWDLLILISRGATSGFDGSSAVHAVCSIGFVTYDGSIHQGCISYSDENGLNAPTSSIGCEIEADVCSRLHNLGPPTESDAVEITARNGAGGFTATKRGAGGLQQNIGFLALKLPGIQGIKLTSRDSRTTSGDDVINVIGFTPQAQLGLFTMAENYDVMEDDADAESFGFGAVAEDSGSPIQVCSAYMSRDNVGTSDTKCVTSAVVMDLPLGSGAVGLKASHSSFDNQGATWNYSNVLGTARKQLILSIGRPIVLGRAMMSGGVGESGKPVAGHRARAKDSGQVAERGAAKKGAEGRAASPAGSQLRAAGAVKASAKAAASTAGVGRAVPVHGARSRAQVSSSEVSSARAALGARGEARVSSGEVGMAQPSVQLGGVGITGRGRAAGQTLGKAQATVGASARAKSSGQSAEVGAGRTAAAGRAAASSLSAESAAASKAAAPRAQASGQAQTSGKATVGAAARAQNAGRFGSTGMPSMGSRAQGTAQAGSVESAKASVVAASPAITGKGFASGQTTGRAAARVAASGRAAAVAGESGQAAPTSGHRARGNAAGQQQAEGSARLDVRARARNAPGVEAAGPGTSQHGGRAKSAPGASSSGRGSSGARARAQVSSGLNSSAWGRLDARARAAAAGGVLSRGGAPAEVAIRFYQRTSRRVREAVRAAASGLPIQFPNLPFAEPSALSMWARHRLSFGEVDEILMGSSSSTYIVPATLELEIRGPIRLGKSPLLQVANSLGDAMQRRELAGVIYREASIGRCRDAGDDEYSVQLTIEISAEDAAFPRSEGAPPADDDFDSAEASVRAYLRSVIPDYPVFTDNLPSTLSATWLFAAMNGTESILVDGVMRRHVGVLEVVIHTPLRTGEKVALSLVDRIVDAFKLVTVGGVRFVVPLVPAGKAVGGQWTQQVLCPWSVDHAS